MHTNGYQRLSWSGFLTVAAGLLAQQGHASNWCPTSTDYQITCSNCSRELTCDVLGISIEILGNNVTLDGQGHYIDYAPYNAVTVWNSNGGAESTVKNLSIWEPGGAGVEFSGGVSSNFGYVENVYTSGSTGAGFHHGSWNPLEISGSWTYYNGYGVIGSYASNSAYTDFLSSSAQGNSEGYFPASSPGSWVRDSYFWNNDIGVNAYYATSVLVDNNSFSSSSGTGLSVSNSTNIGVTNNSGSGNSVYDCVADPADTYAYGNSWGSYSGAGCVY